MEMTLENRITLANGEVRSFRIGTRIADILPQQVDGLPVLAALYNNDVVGLKALTLTNGTIVPLTAANLHGWHVLADSLCFLMAMAINKLFPGYAFRVRHSIGHAIFCTLEKNPGICGSTTSKESLARIESLMKDIVARNLSIQISPASYADVVAEFERERRTDKLFLVRHLNTPLFRVITCGDYCDLYQSPIVPRTGLLDKFELLQADGGFIMNFPSKDNPGVLEPFEPQHHLMRLFRDHVKWGHTLGVTTIGQLNEAISEQRVDKVIQMSETNHDRNLNRIASKITAQRGKVRLVLVAGPSSAGKTTSAKRLCTHLQINGLRPVVIGTDDYFLGEGKEPIGPDGKPDYEQLNSMDLEALNKDLLTLMEGGAIKRRVFDFFTKSPRWTEEEITLGEDGVLIMEGLHGLNPELTSQIPREKKFHIYLSALTQLTLDSNNRISTTDNRLIRRIVRDNKFRGHSAIHTLSLWASVRRGEERWIFPFQQNADAVFNSSLDYELAVLKPYAESLLSIVKPDMPEYTDARRLQMFLQNVNSIPPDSVPGNSILREYIGNSQLQY